MNRDSMKKNTYLSSISGLLISSLAFIGIGCETSDTEQLFDKTPNARLEDARQAIYEELQSSAYGWKLVYFPRIIDEAADTNRFTYLFDFIDNQHVQMEASNHGATRDTSEYDVALGSTLKVRFTTYNFIHELSDAALSSSYGTGGRGAAGDFEFFYYGKDGDDILLRTNRNTTEVRLEKAKAENWGGNKEPLRDSLVKYFQHSNYRLQAYHREEQLNDSLVRINFGQKELSLFTVSHTDTTQVSSSAIGYGVNGIIVMPALKIDDMEFYFFKWNPNERKLTAVIDDRKVEISGVPTIKN